MNIRIEKNYSALIFPNNFSIIIFDAYKTFRLNDYRVLGLEINLDLVVRLWFSKYWKSQITSFIALLPGFKIRNLSKKRDVLGLTLKTADDASLVLKIWEVWCTYTGLIWLRVVLAVSILSMSQTDFFKELFVFKRIVSKRFKKKLHKNVNMNEQKKQFLTSRFKIIVDGSMCH